MQPVSSQWLEFFLLCGVVNEQNLSFLVSKSMLEYLDETQCRFRRSTVIIAYTCFCKLAEQTERNSQSLQLSFSTCSSR